MQHSPLVLSDVTVVTDSQVKPAAFVVIDHGRVMAIESQRPSIPGATYWSCATELCYLMPGMLDLHVHGAAGADCMDGEVAALATISQALFREGVTGFLATTMTASVPKIEQALQAIKIYREQVSTEGAELLGVHLEGPFLSKRFSGAQCVDDIIPPDMALFNHWQQLSGQAIKKITVAPEATGALDFIRALVYQGVQVSIGHSDADYVTTQAAIDAGATQATHLFNAMRPLQQREPGCVGALLLDQRVSAELIADGVHLHPQVIELAWRLKGLTRLLLVTDAMRAKCLGDGCFDLGGQAVTVQQGVARLANGALAGSTLQLNQALINFSRFTGQSIAASAQLVTENPAKLLGLFPERGTIRVGARADCVILTADGQVRGVIQGEQRYGI